MRKISPQNIERTIQEVRKKRFPELPERLIEQIIDLEDRFFDNRTEIFKRIDALVESYLNGGEQ